MEEFYIDVTLRRGMTRIQVDEISPEQWDMPNIPQFVIEFHDGQAFLTLTIQLEDGTWYDRNTRLSDDDFNQRYLEMELEKMWNPDYQSPFSEAELKVIGYSISNYMVVRLTSYMAFFVASFRNPTLN